MEIELKFRDIVTRTALHAQTAQYVLKHPDALTGMPTAGTQGAHRRFTLKQAVRLATCTHLVSSGVALLRAGEVVDFIERRVRMLSKKTEQGIHLYDSQLKTPWLLKVADSNWFTVWNADAQHRFAEKADWFAIDEHQTPTVEEAIVAIARVEINLTLIVKRLTRR